jgi:hypothetical protein
VLITRLAKATSLVRIQLLVPLDKGCKIMYYRDLETVPGAKELHDARQRQMAAERLKNLAARKKLKKQQKQEQL